MKPPLWASAAGLLIGIVIIAWLRPDSTEGAAIIIVVCTAVLVVIGSIIGALRKRGKDEPEQAGEPK